MRIVIAPDKFKGSLTALEAAQAMARGAARACPAAELKLVPMADGGDGTMACLVEATGGRYVTAACQDPLGREREARIGLLAGGETCAVELAEASGLALLQPHELDPLRASTYGFGQLIRAGLDAGARRFTLCLGGSATTDGGAGMLQALGFRLLDGAGAPIGPGGGALESLRTIDRSAADARLWACEWVVACDVDNPLIGPSGAAAVFGPQKGAQPDDVHRLDANLGHLADVIADAAGVRVHGLPGAGAAGGVAAALHALMGARLVPGVRLCLEASGLDRALAGADLVLTGEGRVDAQTLRGKTACGVAQAAAARHVPAIVLGGSVAEDLPPTELRSLGVLAAAAAGEPGMPLGEAMRRAAELLERRTEELVRRWLHGEFRD
ncbi:glycerate kinase [Cohnella lubricantis]|uniref:Glycerate kinase n=1 Tax=Cohnella lubricantis TaxID=2163172 RepID=A0A841TC98_9BACL|nr:glycerate kinase [Cohnella lubricantis]MBB6677766.1 glycerate kinase [Cohnella lubricantis]MBP2118088.1 glycerate kinase [Cohnella lubricantis]